MTTSATITNVAKAAAEGCVTVFETGKLDSGAYSTVTNIRGDTGGLTYGKHQTTINSGSLYHMLHNFTIATGVNAELVGELNPYMPRVLAKDSSLATNAEFVALLKKLGTDPVMQATQDAFFDANYWSPAAYTCEQFGFTRPLSYAIVYDSYVQGAFGTIRDLVNTAIGKTTAVGELAWIEKYNSTRRNWMATNKNPVLHTCVYRQDAFQLLIGSDNWELTLPFKVRGVTLSLQTLGIEAAAPTAPAIDQPVRVSVTPDNPPPLLIVTNPPISNSWVGAVQNALVSFGYPVDVDNSYGPETKAAVTMFQASRSLVSDGIVGLNTYQTLRVVS